MTTNPAASTTSFPRPADGSRIFNSEQKMAALSAGEIASRLGSMPAWQVENGELVRTFKFEDFRAALRFVNRVGDLAEEVGHHPDIDIRYNRVRLGLVTHDAGGLTAKDFDLASKIE
jgi:4a-hydroxytetrahydrobiopterin dehydratase